MFFSWVSVFTQSGKISEQFAYRYFTTRDGLSQMLRLGV